MIEGHVSDLALDPTSPETLFVGIWERGIYKSNNRGEDWIALTKGLPYGPSAGWIKIGMGLRGQYGTQFLLAKMGSPQEFLYRTTDSGQTWNPVWRAPIPPSDPTWASVVSVSPDDESLFFYGGDVLFPPRGSDVGKNPIPDIHLDCHAVAFAPSRVGLCYAATDGGVFRSENNGHSWSAVNNGLQTVQFYSVGVSRSSTLRIGGATHDVGILQSRDGGDWQNAHAGSERGFYIVDPRDDRNVFVFPDSRLERSADGGVTWKMILTGIDKGGRDRIPDHTSGSRARQFATLIVSLGQQSLLQRGSGRKLASVFGNRCQPDTRGIQRVGPLPELCRHRLRPGVSEQFGRDRGLEGAVRSDRSSAKGQCHGSRRPSKRLRTAVHRLLRCSRRFFVEVLRWRPPLAARDRNRSD